jgi:AAA family ATP:ADP antiporter
MLGWIARRLNLEVDETRHALVLGLVLFTLTSSYTLVKTSRDASYLAHHPAESLPWLYLGVALLTFLVAGTVTFGTRRRSTLETLSGTAMVTALSLVVFAYLLQFQASWVSIVLYLWVNVYGLLLMSQFWAFTTTVSNPREAKRTFGVVGVGGILGGLFAGLLAPGLAGIGSLSALLVAGAVLLVGGVAAILIGARGQALTRAETVDESDVRPPHPLRDSYVRWMALAALCSVIVTGIVDYQFKVEIQHRFAEQEALAAFLGNFYTMLNLAALTLQLFVTRWALQRLGAGWAAALLPTGLAIGTGFIIALPGFVSVVSTRLWDQMLRQTVNRSALEMFYFPLEPGMRRQAKSLIQAGLERVGDGLAGGLILILAATVGASVLTVAVLAAIFIAVWVAAWFRVRSDYVSELGRSLRRMHLDQAGMSLSLREASALREMERLLASPYERVVLHALEMLEESAPENLDERLIPLTSHASAPVRAQALRLATDRRLEGVRERAEALLHDESSEVRVAALRAYASLEGDDPIGILRDFMNSEDRTLRVTAVQCAIEFSSAENEAGLAPELERVVREGTTAERTAVAEALGRRAGPSSLHALIKPLLRDADPIVRHAALRSAGRAGLRAHVATLIEALGERASRDAARVGLAAYGDRIVGTLGDWLTDPAVTLEIRREIPRVLGDVGSQEAVNEMFRQRGRDDVRLEYRILKASNMIRASERKVRFPGPLVTEDMEHDARSLLFALVHSRAFAHDSPSAAERLLRIALDERMEQALDRIFRRLALLYPPRDIHAAYRGVTSGDARERGNAVEYVENALAAAHRDIVLPLVDAPDDVSRLRHAERRYRMGFVTYEKSLEALLEGDDPWLRTCALYVVGSKRQRSLLVSVKANLSALHPLVRETALWARQELAAS